MLILFVDSILDFYCVEFNVFPEKAPSGRHFETLKKQRKEKKKEICERIPCSVYKQMSFHFVHPFAL